MALKDFESSVDEAVATAARKVARRAAKEPDETETPAPEPYVSVPAAFADVVKAWEAEQKAKAARTAVGKRFADRVKSANERLKSAIEDGSRTSLGKLHAKLQAAKATVKTLTAKWEEGADADKGKIGKAYRSRGALLEERAEAKEKAGAKLERAAEQLSLVFGRIEVSDLG